MMKSWGEEFQSCLTASLMHSVNHLKGSFFNVFDHLTTKCIPTQHCYRRVATSCHACSSNGDQIHQNCFLLHYPSSNISSVKPLLYTSTAKTYTYNGQAKWNYSKVVHCQNVIKISYKKNIMRHRWRTGVWWGWGGFKETTSVHKK